MYFNLLTCVVALALPPHETSVVPSLFEDFRGTSAIEIRPNADAAYWRLDTLVLADDLSEGRLTLRRLGLRFSGLEQPLRLTGTVTLSTTRADRLRERYPDNSGAAPVTFFVDGKLERGPSHVLGTFAFFDLADGFVLDTRLDGNLLVSFEIQTGGRVQLDAAPTENSQLLITPDALHPVGSLSRQMPVLAFVLEREIEAPRTPLVSPPVRTGGHDQAGLAAQVTALTSKLAVLQRALDSVAEESRRNATIAEAQTRALASLVSEQRMETALVTGRASPLLLAGDPEARLATAHAVVRNAIQAALNDKLEVADAEALLRQARAEGDTGKPARAFATYALAFQALLPASGIGADHPACPPQLRAASRGRAAPYDIGVETLVTQGSLTSPAAWIP